MKSWRKVCPLVNNTAISHVPSGEIGVWDMVEIPERIRIVQRAMFAKAFPVVRALNAMQMPVRAGVGAVNQFAILVKVQAPGIATAFAEKFESVSQWVIAPHALLKLEAANSARHRAALTS